jgi:sulfatase modifying factor 1
MLRLCTVLALALAVGLALSLEVPTSASQDKPIVNAVGMKFARIPAGKFLMGSPATEEHRGSDETLHEVVITREFQLGVHEVTQEQYKTVMGTNPSFFCKEGKGKERIAGKQTTGDHPVESVSWLQAVEFCKKLGEMKKELEEKRTYRLPTEAEWEYACRAGTKQAFHYGNSLDSYKANFNGLIYASYGVPKAGPFFRCPVKIGDYDPNAFGLFDMHGNVQEWCADWYGPYDPDAKEDPQGPKEGTERVLRGGGWPHSGKSLRSAVRNHLSPGEATYSAGFRVVVMIEKKEKV